MAANEHECRNEQREKRIDRRMFLELSGSAVAAVAGGVLLDGCGGGSAGSMTLEDR
jgi:uncharacterized protein YcfJ